MGKPYKYTRNEQTGGYNENNWIHRNGKYGRSNRCRNRIKDTDKGKELMLQELYRKA